MTSQIRNEALNTLLETDFIRRNEPGNLLGNVISTYLALPGLRGFWPMSSVDENGDVYDVTGQGRMLVNTNTVTFNSTDFVPFAEFNGSTNYLTRADETGLDITGDLTIGCWVRFDNALGAVDAIMGKWLSTGNQRGYLLARDASGTVTFFLSNAGNDTSFVNSASSTAQGTWYFAAGRLDAGTETSVFLNNEKTDLGSGIASIFNNTIDFRIGLFNSTLLPGDVALAFLCANALPDNVILNLYQQSRILFEEQ